MNNKKKMNGKIEGKKGMELEVLAWWIIAILVFIVVLFGIIILGGKGKGAIEFIKNLFRFR